MKIRNEIKDNGNSIDELIAYIEFWGESKAFSPAEITNKVRELEKGQINSLSSQGMGVLHYACETGKIDAALMLLENGADVDLEDNSSLRPIHYACAKQNYDMVKILLERNASPNVFNDEGLPLLSEMCVRQDKDIVELLLSYHVDSNLVANNESSNLPLYYATHYSHSATGSKIVQLLLENGADPNLPNAYNDYPIHNACRARNYKIIEQLVKHGAWVDIIDEFGTYPITYLAYFPHSKPLKLLLENGADPNKFVAENSSDVVINVAYDTGKCHCQ